MSDIIGGIRFKDAKAMICTCVDNGVDPDDVRVIRRTNEATKVILDMILPVGGMTTVTLNADGDIVTLPPFLENAVDVEVMDNATVRGSADNNQAFYDVINPSTYVDPSLAHDNPLVDEGLVSAVVPPGSGTSFAVAFVSGERIVTAVRDTFTQDHVGMTIVAPTYVPAETTILAIVDDTHAQMSANAIASTTAGVSADVTQVTPTKTVVANITNGVAEIFAQVGGGSFFAEDLWSEIVAPGHFPSGTVITKIESPTAILTSNPAISGGTGITITVAAVRPKRFISVGFLGIGQSNMIAMSGFQFLASDVNSEVREQTPTYLTLGTTIVGVQGPTLASLSAPTVGGLASNIPVALIGLSRTRTITDANFVEGTYTLLSDSALFTSSDMGAEIDAALYVPAGTTIISVVSPTEVRLSEPAIASTVTFAILTEEAPLGLVRRYQYPGLQPGARLKITGAKRFVPITDDSDYLIVQNIEALKLMILSIERYENNAPTDGEAYRKLSLDLLTAEVTKHVQDPRNVMRRKSRYEDDVRKYGRGSFGWTRARIALEIPGAMLLGKSEIGRLLGDAEMRLMERIPMARGCVKEYRADVHSGHILFPADVDSILGVVMCGVPLDIRAVTFKYLENGPGDGCCSCVPYLEDEGEEYFPTSRNTRRKFRLKGISDTEAARLVFACKIRYVDKEPADQMTVKHYPSLSLMVQAIIMERSEKWNESNAGIQTAFAALQLDLDTYLKGIKLTIPIQNYGFGMGDVGGML